MTNIISRIKQPRYTGKDRCLPCTFVNISIAAIISGVIAIGSPMVGAGIFLISIVVIYFRGYLIPGTPTLTKRYFPKQLLKVFGKGPLKDSIQSDFKGKSTEWIDRESLLSRLKVVEKRDKDLHLTDEFESSWKNYMNSMDESERSSILQNTSDHSSSDIRFEDGEHDHFAAYVEETPIGRWESSAAFKADMAAIALFNDQKSKVWDSLSAHEQNEVVGTLRLFLESCPDCGGEISIEKRQRKRAARRL